MSGNILNHIKGRLGANFTKLIGEITYSSEFFYTVEERKSDYGVDLDVKQQGFRTISGKSEACSTNLNLSLQIKTTSHYQETTDTIKHDLDASNYRTIVDSFRTAGATKIILVLVIVPEDMTDCITCEEDINLKIKAYRHVPEYDEDKYSNTSTVTVDISKQCQISASTIHDLYANDQIFIHS